MHKHLAFLALLAASSSASANQWFLGEWEINEAQFPGITAMTDQEAAVWIGETIVYNKNIAHLVDEACHNPTYESEYIYNDGLEFDSYTLESLGLTEFPIEMISVSCDTGYRGLGSTLIIKNKNSGFTIWDGAFFLTTKKDM